MKKEKKAQVTVFIIIAILIIGLIGLFFVFKEKLGLIGINTKVEPVYNFVQDCIKKIGENALERIGEQGGYFFIPNNNPSIDSRIPYYIHNKNIYSPKKEDIENSLSGFVYEELSFCILNFKDFRDEFEIEHNLKNVKTEIIKNKVRFNLEYPISVTKEDNTYQLEEFEVEIPVRLKTIYDTTYKIIDEQRTHFDSICLSCLYDLGKENEVHVDMLDYGKDTTIFTIIDDKSQLNNESYEFNFAIQYE